MAIKYQWINIDDTHIFCEKIDSALLPEWQPIGQVTLRQIYKDQPAKWYCWDGPVTPGLRAILIGKEDSLKDAKAFVEESRQINFIKS